MNIFEQIIAKKIKADIIFENKKIIAIKDIDPIKVGHFLVIPKKYSQNLLDIKNKDLAYLILTARKLAKQQIKKLGKKGFKLVINNGKTAGQEVFHTHVHIIPM